MALQRKSFKTILLGILLGIAIGTLVGEILGKVLPPGIPRDVLSYSTAYTFGPLPLDLMVLSLTLGFSIKFNLLSFLGVFVMIQLLKWSW